MADNTSSQGPVNPFDVSTSRNDIEALIRSVSMKNGLGFLKAALTGAYYGLNLRGNMLPLPHNTDNNGMIFFTRPRLNLSYDNVTADRTFTPMLAQEDNGPPKMWRAIRAYLDPLGSQGIRFHTTDGLSTASTNGDGTGIKFQDGKTGSILAYPSRLVDPRNAFITLLTNTCLSVTGWPDSYVDVYRTKAGIYKEELSMYDGYAKNYGAFDLNCTFQNVTGDPIGYLFHVWTQYGSFVKEGIMDPWPDSILENEMDFNTRIYRLALDPQRRYVQAIYAVGAAFPKTNPNGARAEYDVDKPYNEATHRYPITFECNGMIIYDAIAVYEFNAAVQIFNESMSDSNRSNYLTKLLPHERFAFNFAAYPRINPDTMELEWWVFNEIYEQLSAVLRLTDPPQK